MSEERDNAAIVRSFCEAWSRRDAAELMPYFAAGAVYHNIPTPPIEGVDAIARFIGRFMAETALVEFEIKHLAAAGDVVFTERVDRFHQGGRQIELPVAGVFELREGKIAAWRDYFDLATWTKQARS